MKISRIISEAPSSVRWHLYSIYSKNVYSKAVASCGESLMIVSPLKIKGSQRMHFGNNVLLREGAWIQTEGEGVLKIGDNFHLGHRGHLHAVADVTIGDNCVFGDNVMINSGVHMPGNLAKITHQGPIVIGDNVFLGKNVCVLGGVTVGDGAIVGAGAVVTRDVPENSVVAGVPARPIAEKQTRTK